MAKKMQKKRKPQAQDAKSSAKPKARKTVAAKEVKAAGSAGPKKSEKKKAPRTPAAAAKPATRKAAAKPKPMPAPAVTPPDEPITDVAPLTDAQLRRAKSGLSRSDLQAFRQLLLHKRAEILGDVAALESDVRTDSGDHFSPEHMADVGSINYEQEFTLGLMESEQRMLREIDEAIMRINARTYGVCVETGQPIGKPRLDAKPWAKYCIEVARESIKEVRRRMKRLQERVNILEEQVQVLEESQE